MTYFTSLSQEELNEAVREWVWKRMKNRIISIEYTRHEPHPMQQYGTPPAFTARVCYNNLEVV